MTVLTMLSATDLMTVDAVSQLKYLIGILLALVLGFAIGFERKLRFKEAGIRTHTIVCVGAALIMVVSKFGFEGQTADVSRVAAQIVSGVGFLGAGIIMFRGQKMHGLTTAAGVWATAGVGMAAGAGLYVLATLATVLLIVAQCIFHLNIKLFRTKRYYQVNICFLNYNDESSEVKEIFSVAHFNSLTIERRENSACIRDLSRASADDKDADAERSVTVYHATINTDIEYSSQRLNQIMAEHPYILSIERCDDN